MISNRATNEDHFLFSGTLFVSDTVYTSSGTSVHCFSCVILIRVHVLLYYYIKKAQSLKVDKSQTMAVGLQILDSTR
jgi:hypothetical protein